MTVSELLAKTRIEVSPETFHIVSVSPADWARLLENPELSPDMKSPFLIFKDRWEITLVLHDIDFEKVSYALRDAKKQMNLRLISFDVELEFDVVGFMARIALIFAEAGISILPFSSYSRDHVLIRQEDLAIALKAFRGHVRDVC